MLQKRTRLQSALALGGKFEERHLTDISYELLERQRLIIYGETTDHGDLRFEI